MTIPCCGSESDIMAWIGGVISWYTILSLSLFPLKTLNDQYTKSSKISDSRDNNIIAIIIILSD